MTHKEVLPMETRSCPAKTSGVYTRFHAFKKLLFQKALSCHSLSVMSSASV